MWRRSLEFRNQRHIVTAHNGKPVNPRKCPTVPVLRIWDNGTARLNEKQSLSFLWISITDECPDPDAQETACERIFYKVLHPGLFVRAAMHIGGARGEDRNGHFVDWRGHGSPGASTTLHKESRTRYSNGAACDGTYGIREGWTQCESAQILSNAATNEALII